MFSIISLQLQLLFGCLFLDLSPLLPPNIKEETKLI